LYQQEQMNSAKHIQIGILTHLSRSGSTLLSRILDEYAEICVTTESELPLELFGVKSYTPIVFNTIQDIEKYLDHTLQSTRIASWKLSTSSILDHCQQVPMPISGPQLVEILLTAYRDTYKPDASLVIYKACPFMPWHIPESLEHFPGVKFLHLLRDPRAVFHSQRQSIDPFTRKPYSKSVIKTGLDWQKAAALEEIDSTIMELRYEDLVSSPDEVTNATLNFLEIAQARKVENNDSFIRRMDNRDQELHKEIVEAPDPNKNTVWQTNLTSQEISLMDAFLMPTLVSKGYDPISPESDNSLRLKLMIQGGLVHQNLVKILKRTSRVLQHLVKNPQHLFRKARLKVLHG